MCILTIYIFFNLVLKTTRQKWVTEPQALLNIHFGCGRVIVSSTKSWCLGWQGRRRLVPSGAQRSDRASREAPTRPRPGCTGVSGLRRVSCTHAARVAARLRPRSPSQSSDPTQPPLSRSSPVPWAADAGWWPTRGLGLLRIPPAPRPERLSAGFLGQHSLNERLPANGGFLYAPYNARPGGTCAPHSDPLDNKKLKYKESRSARRLPLPRQRPASGLKSFRLTSASGPASNMEEAAGGPKARGVPERHPDDRELKKWAAADIAAAEGEAERRRAGLSPHGPKPSLHRPEPARRGRSTPRAGAVCSGCAENAPTSSDRGPTRPTGRETRRPAGPALKLAGLRGVPFHRNGDKPPRACVAGPPLKPAPSPPLGPRISEPTTLAASLDPPHPCLGPLARVHPLWPSRRVFSPAGEFQIF